MLKDNIRNIRLAKGMTQEQLAQRLHVVRQTVSKWEKGLSVPDAEMLLRIAELYEVEVAELLGDGAGLCRDNDNDAVAEQLARICEELAIRNRRVKRILIIFLAIIIGIPVVVGLLVMLFMVDPDDVTVTVTELIRLLS